MPFFGHDVTMIQNRRADKHGSMGSRCGIALWVHGSISANSRGRPVRHCYPPGPPPRLGPSPLGDSQKKPFSHIGRRGLLKPLPQIRTDSDTQYANIRAFLRQAPMPQSRANADSMRNCRRLAHVSHMTVNGSANRSMDDIPPPGVMLPSGMNHLVR